MKINDNFLKREKLKVNLNSYDIAKHIYKMDFINMGSLSEENMFLEAEEEAKATPKPDSKVPPADKKADPNADKSDKEAFAKPGDNPPKGDSNPDDPFGGSETESEEDSVLLEGLPKDEQYYVIILKTLHKKLLKLGEVSLKLFNSKNDKDKNIIDKINTLTYVFNRFIEQYDEYDKPKVIILKLQKLIDSVVIYVSEYIKQEDK